MDTFRRLFGRHRSNSSALPPPIPASLPESFIPSILSASLPLQVTSDNSNVPDQQALLTAIQTLIQTPFNKLRVLLHTTPILMAPAAPKLLTSLAHSAKEDRPQLSSVYATYADLLQMVQRDGIDPAMDALENAPSPATMHVPNGDPFLQWIDASAYWEGRRFLQGHPDLISSISEERLRQGLVRAQQREMPDAQQKEQMIEDARQRLYLMIGIRARLADMPQPPSSATVTTAILESYIDWSGGFMHDLPAWLSTTIQEGFALSQQGQVYQTAQARVVLWQEALQRAQHEGLPDEIQAEIMQSEGLALADIADGTRAAALEKRILLFQRCLNVYTRERYPKQWAATQHNLGFAYYERIRGDKTENVEQSITCYSAALHIHTKTMLPYLWATTQNNLGQAYYERIRGDKTENLEQSVACYTAALRVYSEATVPVDWAMTQNNLGNTYLQRIRGDKADNQEQAIACYIAALHIHTEDALPLDWAMTQHNLGTVYYERIRGDELENLEQSIIHYDAALRFYTEDTLPFDWAMTQHNLGNAYQNRISGDKSDNQEQAIACYTAALCIHTEDTLPHQWAATQNNLGNTYYQRLHGDKAENVEQAIACYTAALRVRTEDALPLDWAMTQNNLGNAYAERISGNQTDNLNQAIACYTAALRIRTEDALPVDHRRTALNLAQTWAQQGQWDAVAATYRSALRAEDSLVALTSGAKGQDAVLAQGHDGAARAAYALARLGQLEEATVTLERGRARGLASARTFDAADPQRIRDPQRRSNYLIKRAAWQEALSAVQQHEERLPMSREASPSQGENLRRLREEQHTSQRVVDQRLHEAKVAFDAAIEAIQAAGDPADFLRADVTEPQLLLAARRNPSGHAVMAIVATPQGGMALGTVAGDVRRGHRDRFAICDLPALTVDTHSKLISHILPGTYHTTIGGFLYAQEGSILGFLRRDWGDHERPVWNGSIPLQQWEKADRPRHEQAMNTTTFTAMAEALHMACIQHHLSSALDLACQDILAERELQMVTRVPWGQLDTHQIVRLDGILRHKFLRYELERCLATLSNIAIRPLADWLLREGISSVTIIPCGWLAAFPLLACPIDEHQTFADIFSASVAPSFRSLLPREQNPQRSGVATLGNPWPTHQPLKYGQAEAITLASLGGDSTRCRIQYQATREWLLTCLQTAQVVDASCHGSVDPDYLASCLQLADTPLTLADALNKQIAEAEGLRLLILSACQTAIPDLRGARDEVRSLAVGMLQAGVEAVLASLWSVDDRATYLLVVRFAQEWFPKEWNPTTVLEPPAAALARAQFWLRNVTWKDLQSWEATSVLPSILANMPDFRTANQPDPAVGDARLAVVRGSISYFDDDAGRNDRYTMQEGQDHIRATAERRAKIDPDHRPYAHPFYWAGFQINGW